MVARDEGLVAQRETNVCETGRRRTGSKTVIQVVGPESLSGRPGKVCTMSSMCTSLAGCAGLGRDTGSFPLRPYWAWNSSLEPGSASQALLHCFQLRHEPPLPLWLLVTPWDMSLRDCRFSAQGQAEFERDGVSFPSPGIPPSLSGLHLTEGSISGLDFLCWKVGGQLKESKR